MKLNIEMNFFEFDENIPKIALCVFNLNLHK